MVYWCYEYAYCTSATESDDVEYERGESCQQMSSSRRYSGHRYFPVCGLILPLRPRALLSIMAENDHHRHYGLEAFSMAGCQLYLVFRALRVLRSPQLGVAVSEG